MIGQWTPDIDVLSVRANDDYTLHIQFNDGKDVIYDVSPMIAKGGVFVKLKDIKYFKRAHPAYGTVIWDDMLDIAPEELYENGVSA